MGENKMGQLNFLERTIQLMDKYGLWKVFQATLLLIGFVYITQNLQNLPNIVSSAFSKETEIKQEQHDAAVEVRRSIKPEIDRLLKDAMATVGADRAFIIEMHNGTNNTAGLPFIYGEMTYEEVKDGIVHIDEDYTNLNLSRFNFPMYLEKCKRWHGTVSDLSKIDSKLASRLMSNDVYYIGLITLNGIHNELGYFGLSFCEEGKVPNRIEFEKCLGTVGQKLSILLDTNEF